MLKRAHALAAATGFAPILRESKSRVLLLHEAAVCRVAPANTKNHEYESQKDRGCLSFQAVNSIVGVARLSGPPVNLPLQMRSNITKGEELGLLLHGDHHLFCELTDTRYSPSRHHSGTV